MVIKRLSTYAKGTTLKLFIRYCKENEITEAELLRDLIREFVKRKYNLGDGINKSQL